MLMPTSTVAPETPASAIPSTVVRPLMTTSSAKPALTECTSRATAPPPLSAVAFTISCRRGASARSSDGLATAVTALKAGAGRRIHSTRYHATPAATPTPRVAGRPIEKPTRAATAAPAPTVVALKPGVRPNAATPLPAAASCRRSVSSTSACILPVETRSSKCTSRRPVTGFARTSRTSASPASARAIPTASSSWSHNSGRNHRTRPGNSETTARLTGVTRCATGSVGRTASSVKAHRTQSASRSNSR